MSMKRRSIAALAMAPLLLAACSNGGTDGDSSTAANSSTATNREKAVKFAECMRENGVTQFPDPNESGELTLDGVVKGLGLDPNAPAAGDLAVADPDVAFRVLSDFFPNLSEARRSGHVAGEPPAAWSVEGAWSVA
jgi:hypothetical protein